MFADVCTPDAEDALAFSSEVELYLRNKSDDKLLLEWLDKWISNDDKLIKISENAPLVTSLLPISKNLKTISESLKNILLKKSTLTKTEIDQLLSACNSKEYADVELAVYPTFKKLFDEYLDHKLVINGDH